MPTNLTSSDGLEADRYKYIHALDGSANALVPLSEALAKYTVIRTVDDMLRRV